MGDKGAKLFRRWGFAWLALCSAFVLHVLDEALNDFLAVYNPTVKALREKFPWAPLPTFAFIEWIALLGAAILILFLLSIYAFRGIRPLSYIFAVVMLVNGLQHIGVSLYSGALMPGALSSPLLLVGAIYLLSTALQSRKWPNPSHS
jgi:hypothetical protein